jgi:hypothetical protein
MIDPVTTTDTSSRSDSSRSDCTEHVDADVSAKVELVLDFTTILMQMQLTAQSSQEDASTAAIENNHQAVLAEAAQAQKAADDARDHAETGSFWGEVASVAKTIATAATVVTVAVSAVATGGLSCVAVLALSGVLLSSSSSQIAGALGGSKDLEAGLNYVGLGLGLGAAGCAVFAPSALGTLSAGATSKLAIGAEAVGGGSTVVAGYATIKQGYAHGDQLEAEADGAAARAHLRTTNREIDDLIAGFKELEATFGRIKESVAGDQKEVSDASLGMLATLAR